MSKPPNEEGAVIQASETETIIVATQGQETFTLKIERNLLSLNLINLLFPLGPKWSSGPIKFIDTFPANDQTIYLLEGKVKATCEGYYGCFEISGGDFIEFPKRMTETWDIIEAVGKHYSLEK